MALPSNLWASITLAREIDAIVAFLEALTDERVVLQRAPFDHPQLLCPPDIQADRARRLTRMVTGLLTM